MRLPEFFAQRATPVSLAKGQALFRQGTLVEDLFSISQGSFKAYYLSENGTGRIKSFLAGGEVIGSLQSAHRNIPSPFSVVPLESSELLRLDFQTLNKFASDDLELSTDLIGAQVDLAVKKEQPEYEFLCLIPEQRYHALHRRAPAWLSRITQSDIALYLGVAPESLSRIRRRLAAR
ncbi:Crp/Fnr family transcriptional regulator [Pelagicoccus sp. SDUM812002]|uniref:Crp/Fnr family transcriptional regulator n=1 Tax=Pelagicoccus sp. SDUM812002 TaxID=3041266 RepID=UPI00280F4B26|nr:Crp/Fnr family transcriptional regulator [Pelagicoccus sp. SDUM812002]MDQ8185095.1 Crp/Fnr family transcriptional regulator [Pelagicoccus sp. SDUM812002]